MHRNGKSKDPYRFFLSYSHDDREVAERIAAVLRGRGLRPHYDATILPGKKIPEEIQERIAESHLFIPVFTKQSMNSPWVHQETGFAIAIDVPIVPIAIDVPPPGMFTQILTLSRSNWESKLKKIDVEDLVKTSPHQKWKLMHVADTPNDRTQLLVQYAKELIHRKRLIRVRQRALFSSFSLPDRSPSDPIWGRLGLALRGDPAKLREERLALQEHARGGGCSLILVLPTFVEQYLGEYKARLEVLIPVLESMKKWQVVIACTTQEDTPSTSHLTILGDWVSAGAAYAVPGGEIQNTGFDCRAASALRWALLFDEESEKILRDTGTTPKASLPAAIKTLRKRLDEVDRLL